MGKNKQLVINMTAQILGFLVSSCISFFLTPYVVENVGVEAYGFVNLANNFVSYANLVSVALNSMAGTFITIKLHKNYEEEANKYFTSVVIANIFLAIITSTLAVFIVINLDKLIKYLTISFKRCTSSMDIYIFKFCIKYYRWNLWNSNLCKK